MVSPDQQENLNRDFESSLTQLNSQTLIAKIRDIRRTFDEVTYPQLLTRLSNWARPERIEVGEEEIGFGGSHLP